jgi:DHA1 family chloramphenicol resistance protein-like MFS transporter
MPALLYLLALAVFAQGTSEFVLAGLLPGIATDLDVSVGQAGLLTSAFALGMALGAPVMAAVGRRWSPRWTLTAFLALFIAAHVLGALTDSFNVLLLSRVVAALANAGFLAVALSTVAQVVPTERQARGLAVILGGTTLALVAGVPAGALVGDVLGWRSTLWAIVALCLPALIAVAVAAPTRTADEGRDARATVRHELAVLRTRPLQVALLLGVLVNGATFCSLTYLAVMATGPEGLTERAVPGLLAVFGIGAFLGVTVAGRFADQHWHRIIDLTLPALVVGWALLALSFSSPVALWITVGAQGGLSFALGSTVIGRIVATARSAPTLGGAYATVALNLGAVVGPVIGSLALDLSGGRGPALASSVLVVLAGGVWLTARRRSDGA